MLDAEKTIPKGADDATRDMILFGAVGGNVKIYNLSSLTFETLTGQEAGQLHQNLIDYTTRFSGNARDIFLEKFLFTDQFKRLNDGGILFQVFQRFCEIDLHPDEVSNIEMEYLFEEVMRNASLRHRFGIESRNSAQASQIIRAALDRDLISPADSDHPKSGYVPFWA